MMHSTQSKNSRISLFEQAKEATSQAAKKAIENMQSVLSKGPNDATDLHQKIVQSEESYFDIENDENQNDNLDIKSNSAVSEEVNELMKKQMRERQDKLLNQLT